MAVQRPQQQVTIGGVEQQALEWNTVHSVEAGMGTASVVLPSPPPNGVFEGAVVRIKIKGDVGDADWRTVFEGRVRGPVERSLTDSDATVTARCDGNLWRLQFPATYDMTWVGPITPRKLIRQMLAFRGVQDAHVEEFVHPTTGVPLLLGGVPWFDEGRIVCPSGTSPFSFLDRICRLFGYRLYDRPDGRVRVSRVCGPPKDADYTMEEGVDLLSPQKSIDLHDITTYWEVDGASGTNLAGQQVQIISRPRRGIRSHFIPNPPKYANGSDSDALLVTQYLADAARIVHEFDQGGPQWSFTSEVVGAARGLTTLAPNQVVKVHAPSIGLGSGDGKKFWQISVAHDFGPQGFWQTFELWRPTGKPARSAPPEPPVDPEEPPTTAPTDAELDPTDDPADPAASEPLPTGYDTDPLDPAYDPGTDPDGAPPVFDATDPALPTDDSVPFDPIDPSGGTSGMVVGTMTNCPPAASAPPQQCQTVGLTEPGWEDDLSAGDLIESFYAPAAADQITVGGEWLGTGATVQLWQNGAMVGSATAPDADPVDWASFSLAVPGPLAAGTAELHILGTA